MDDLYKTGKVIGSTPYGEIYSCVNRVSGAERAVKVLTKELKALGAHNVNSGRQTGLTGKQRIRGLIAAYDQQRNEQGLLPASYQTWYGVLEKPALEHSMQQQGLG